MAEDKKCGYYYEPKKECVKMTRILQDKGCAGFHAIMPPQRNCCGIKGACYFVTRKEQESQIDNEDGKTIGEDMKGGEIY